MLFSHVRVHKFPDILVLPVVGTSRLLTTSALGSLPNQRCGDQVGVCLAYAAVAPFALYALCGQDNRGSNESFMLLRQHLHHHLSLSLSRTLDLIH